MRQLSGLPLSSRLLLLQAILLMPCIGISLRICGFARTRVLLASLLKGRSRSANSCTAEVQRAEVIAQMVKIAANHGFFHARCLHQSLALWGLLTGENIPSEIKIGIPKKTYEYFNAHCWVECCGFKLNDTELMHQRYAVFPGDTSGISATK